MSFIHRPRAIINGIRRTRTYRFFWCRQCDRTVRIASLSDPYGFPCPLCYNLLHQELHISRPSLAVQDREPSTLLAAQLLDTMAEMIEPPSFNNPMDPLTSEIEELMPLVNVTPGILENDQTCPICKEDFVVDEQIRKMPCCHFYHSGCIIPWIRVHNTCPVCRYQIPITQSSDNNADSNSGALRAENDYSNHQEGNDDFRFEEVVNLSWPSWTELVSLWPFDFSSILNWSFQDDEDPLNDTASSRAAGLLLNVFTVEIVGKNWVRRRVTVRRDEYSRLDIWYMVLTNLDPLRPYPILL